MIDHNLLKIFVKVAEQGSFTRAAKMLNQPKSRVSRGVARLEDSLGVQLIRRTTRKSTLTETGKEFYQKVHPLLLGIDHEVSRINEKDKEMSGVIKITATESIAQIILGKIISEYSKRYPRVEFQVIVTNDKLDLTQENIDIAFRAGKLEDSTLIQKKFIETRFILVTSPEYHQKFGAPETIKELNAHQFLGFSPVIGSDMKDFDEISSAVMSDSLSMLRTMVLKGSGITILPEFYCDDLIEEKRLLRVVPSWISKLGHIHILYPPTKNLPKRVKEFISLSKKLYPK
jgi:DNA-binding transcriptional LysR family regulator